ncbi:MAG: hypothetical protein JWM41_3949 [Gemmatimonadetes bacterium]|nr:hypothetical protein [Gemmatimonadota bacterium]
MIPLSPVLLIASAGALLDGARAGQSTRRLAEQFLSQARQPDARHWDLAFVHHAGFWSHFDHRTGKSSWPLPSTATCDELADFACIRNVLSAEGPVSGEVFLLRSPSKRRFVHAGIVLAAERFNVGAGEPPRYECHTIEANITSTGCIGGDRLARVRRILSPGRGDRTIRWSGLEQRIVSTRRRAA